MFRLPSLAPRGDKEYHEEIEKAREKLLLSILKDKCSARNLLRFAYASQFSIASHFKDGTENTAKAHLNTIEEIHSKHRSITYPDLYQLAGIVAVKVLDGPDIDFVPGRKDSPIFPDVKCLPDLTKSSKEIAQFFKKVNISDAKHIVALCGGLKLATAGDQNPDLKFDNCFSSPSYEALFEADQEFSNIVKSYANSKDDFFKDYIEAHKKFSSEPDLVPPPPPYSSAVGVGVAVAAAVVIFSIFYLIHKRRTRHLSQQFP